MSLAINAFYNLQIYRAGRRYSSSSNDGGHTKMNIASTEEALTDRASWTSMSRISKYNRNIKILIVWHRHLNMAKIYVLFKLFLDSQNLFELICICAWMRLLVFGSQKLHYEIILNGYICMTCIPKISLNDDQVGTTSQWYFNNLSAFSGSDQWYTTKR
jgi:hypothetical protein